MTVYAKNTTKKMAMNASKSRAAVDRVRHMVFIRSFRRKNLNVFQSEKMLGRGKHRQEIRHKRGGQIMQTPSKNARSHRRHVVHSL